MRKVLVFGVFDGVHTGHRAFFKQAREHGDHLTAVVAPDDVVEQLKHRLPRKDVHERMRLLGDEDLVDDVVMGDTENGTYNIVKKIRPDVIALGYDQKTLQFDLEEHLRDFDWEANVVVLKPHEPEKYHSSLLDSSKLNNSEKERKK